LGSALVKATHKTLMILTTGFSTGVPPICVLPILLGEHGEILVKMCKKALFIGLLQNCLDESDV